MKAEVNLDDVYAPSDDVVAKEIEGEIIIVPLSADIGGMEDALYTMNDTGKAIWDRLDGKNSLKDVVEKLSIEYKASFGEIEKDVIKLVEELLIKKMLVETS
ncbi:MAG: PqqD family protein [Deltaproteobacteria bacterium]|nr:PqqD family protein [Deltaproteobacteria bacterium]